MPERTCLTCASTLPERKPGTPGRKRLYCSKVCRPTFTPPRPRRIRDCMFCGSEIRATRPNHAKYCSADCRTQAGRPSPEIRRAQERARYVPTDYPDRPCVICGASFKPKTKISQCCSRACANKKNRDSSTKRCAQADCTKPVRAKGLCANHYNLQRPWRKRLGNPETRRANLRRKTQLRRARLRDPDAEFIDRDIIANRDGWRCGLCGKRIGRQYVWPDPRSASLDHIEPLSLGGEHTLANVQIAHLSCNMAKGNRGGGEQLLLIG